MIDLFVTLLGFFVTALTLGGVILGTALWRLHQRVGALEPAVVQTAQALNEHVGAPRVGVPPLADAFVPIDDADAEEFLRNWNAASPQPWEDS